MGLQAVRPDALDHPEALAELGEGLEEGFQGAVRHQLVAAPEVADHPLADARAVADGLNDLQIFVGAALLDATLYPDEHAGIVAPTEGKCKEKARHALRF
ncbi:MAG TPA: hypothetical protein VED59_02075 [Acidimicrobiales bacterium]|nr:hypothetical protein [Acidimicrobiales bacterium]